MNKEMDKFIKEKINLIGPLTENNNFFSDYSKNSNPFTDSQKEKKTLYNLKINKYSLRKFY